MWRRVRNILTDIVFGMAAIGYVWKAPRLSQDARRARLSLLVHLLRQMPGKQATSPLSALLAGAGGQSAVLLVQNARDLLVQDPDALIHAAQALAYWTEFDEAETLLWQAIRLYPVDSQVWKTALECALDHFVFAPSYIECRRARHRLTYLLHALPEKMKSDPAFSAYVSLESTDLQDMLEFLPFAAYLWGQGHISEARHLLSEWWSVAKASANLPDRVSRTAIFWMLGLGLFEEVAQDVTVHELEPQLVAVANWFRGMSLEQCDDRGNHPVPLVLLTRWTEQLTNRRRPLSVIWHSFLRSNRKDELFIVKTLLCATLGLKCDGIRKQVEQYLASWSPFLPYLHFLCVASARAGWSKECRELWRRIQSFDVDYARKAELQAMVETLPAEHGVGQ